MQTEKINLIYQKVMWFISIVCQDSQDISIGKQLGIHHTPWYRDSYTYRAEVTHHKKCSKSRIKQEAESLTMISTTRWVYCTTISYTIKTVYIINKTIDSKEEQLRYDQNLPKNYNHGHLFHKKRTVSSCV